MKGRFEDLRRQLEKENWPNLYFFKFIMPSDNEKIARISSIFSHGEHIQMRPSSKGNYVSLSVKKMMPTADSIIEIYEKAAQIEGVMTI